MVRNTIKVGILLIWFAIMLLWFSVTAANAKCYCACVNNEIKQICENSWDIEKYCSEGLWCSGSSEE